MRWLLFIPLWLLTCAFKPLFPESHPWKRQPWTLRVWVERGTPIAVELSLMLWLALLCSTVLTVVLFRS